MDIFRYFTEGCKWISAGTLLRGVNGYLPVIYKFLERGGLISF